MISPRFDSVSHIPRLLPLGLTPQHLVYETESQAEVKRADALTSIMIKLMAAPKLDDDVVMAIIKEHLDADQQHAQHAAAGGAAKGKAKSKTV